MNMFSALTFDSGREPLRTSDLLPAMLGWVQNMGGWAAFALVLWLLVGYVRMRPADRARIPGWQTAIMATLTIAMLVAYLPIPYYWFRDTLAWYRNEPPAEAGTSWNIRAISMTVGGALAITAVLLPLLANIPYQRLRRIGGIARLSFKEALRSRILYAFSGFILLLLFAGWFIPYKPESQVSVYVSVMFTPMKMLLCLAAAVVASFSIPKDIKQQTIHTVVTKPVERFEIVLGRFFGFTALFTLILAAVALGSLLYVLRGVDPLAAEESLKARDPLYGELHYENVAGQVENKGINVGKEWDYRSHISGGDPGQPKLFAVWEFPSIPRTLTGRQRVRCEFAFDIYRTNKGAENQAIPCRFTFVTAAYKAGNDARYQKERETQLAVEKDHSPEKVAAIDAEAVRKFGYYEVPSFGVVDYHTQWFEIPGAVLDAAAASTSSATSAEQTAAPLRVRVDVLIPSQFVGMAKHDLYLRMDDPEAAADTLWFSVNYFKAAVGVWLVMLLVIGVAVALSTNLSGVIALLVCWIVFMSGANRDFIKELATKSNVEGPWRSLYKIAKREPGAGWVDDSAVAKAATQGDMVFRWVFRRFLDVIPDPAGLDVTHYVANGFNIPWLELLGMVGLSLGYLVPWFVLAYYLLRWREIAGPL
jgi:hypothetical protein